MHAYHQNKDMYQFYVDIANRKAFSFVCAKLIIHNIIYFFLENQTKKKQLVEVHSSLL